MMSVPKGRPKIKFNRQYYAWQPNAYAGPLTEVLDTVLKPKPPEEDDGTTRNS